MTRLNCIIVDDEPQARKLLESYVLKLPELKLAAQAKNAMEAFQLIQENPIDLVFLDINMPEVTGIGLLHMLRTPPLVIMTTAYSEYALQSYEFDVIDYLLKPIRFERFVKGVTKAIKAKEAEILAQDIKPFSDHLEFKADGALKKLKLDDILFIQSLGNYLKIVTPVKTYVTLKTTKEAEELLPKVKFIRIHKSFIINFEKISSTEKEEVMIGKHRLPVGKTYKKYFFSLTNRNSG